MNAAAPEMWACRKVSVQLRPTLDADAPRGHGNARGAYPLLDKVYDLGADRLKKLDGAVDTDEWVLEIAYEDVAPYPPLMRVEEQQRVSVVFELLDEGEAAISAQGAVQAMPVTKTMIWLGGVKQPIWAPIRIPT